ncbi:hypothetical protein F5B20DRAFT_524052 [Whalleya microplaca]|nr:hypothetical protein F5B20DRAFT_524052 [Whalleya microplaca]
MALNAGTFDNPAANNAPYQSAWGYHCGPITNANPGWIPARQTAARAAGTAVPAITTGDNASPPNAAAALSSMNGGVCWVLLNDGVNMCGVALAGQPALRRHMRSFHPGAVTNPRRAQTSIGEENAGTNALKRYVVSGAWRRAQFNREPGRGPENGLIERYATACELIAAKDAVFRANFGDGLGNFHREK